MSLKLPDYLNPVTRIDNDLFYQFVFHILFQKCHSLVCFPLLPVPARVPQVLLPVSPYQRHTASSRSKKSLSSFPSAYLSYNAIQLFCATSIDLIVELILSLTDKGELLFIAKVKYRKLQPEFVAICRINGWSKCRY